MKRPIHPVVEIIGFLSVVISLVWAYTRLYSPDTTYTSLTGTPLFRFGIISDVQYADLPDSENFHRTERRSYAGALQGLRTAVDYWNSRTPDIKFIAQLGDLIDGQNAGTYGEGLAKFSGVSQSAKALEAALSVLDQCVCRTVLHSIGNHELYNFDRAQLRETLFKHWEGKSYYSMAPAPGWRVVMLDSYDVAIIGHEKGSTEYEDALALLRQHNKNDVLTQGTVDWFEGLEGTEKRFVPFNGGVGKTQLAWLQQTLSSACPREKVVIFSHIALLPLSDNIRTLLWNYEDVLRVIHSQGRGCVVAVFSGHTHRNEYGRDPVGIHHVTLNTPLTSAAEGFSYGHVEVFPDRLVVVGKGSLPSRTLKFS